MATFIAVGLLPTIMLLLSRGGVHEDINMILTPAAALIRDGDLRSAGTAYPLQFLREVPSPAEAFHYWRAYFAPVLIFLPFVAILGTATATPFVVGQVACLLATAAVWLWAFRKEHLPSIALFAFMACICWSLFGSLYRTPTQLVAYPTLFGFWMLTERAESRKASVLAGSWLAIATDCRTECIGLACGFVAWSLWDSRNEPRRSFRDVAMQLAPFLGAFFAVGKALRGPT